MRAALFGGVLLLSVSSNANAAELIFNYNGVVNSEQQFGVITSSPLGSAPVKIGDVVSARFSVNPEAVTFGGCISFGGGLSCSHNVTLQGYVLSIGSYTSSIAQLPAALYIQNDIFGQDAVGFAFTDATAGPFDSTLTSVQFQGRYSGNTLTSSDFSSSLPFQAADWSLFAFFSGPAGRIDFHGPLTLQDSLTPAVPEPASWLMMILGVAAIGASMRNKLKRRRYVKSVVATDPALAFALK